MTHLTLGHILTDFLDRSESQRKNNNTRARCKRKAARLGIEIEIERDPCGNGYWLTNTDWDDGNFSESWDEVEEKLDLLAEERK